MKNLVTPFLRVQWTKSKCLLKVPSPAVTEKWFFCGKDFVRHFHPHGGWSIKLNTGQLVFCSELYWVTSSSFRYLNSVTRLLFPHEITSGLVLPCNWSQYWACKSTITRVQTRSAYAKFSFKSFHADRKPYGLWVVTEALTIFSNFFILSLDIRCWSFLSLQHFFIIPLLIMPPFAPSLPPPCSSSFTHLLPPLTFSPPLTTLFYLLSIATLTVHTWFFGL